MAFCAPAIVIDCGTGVTKCGYAGSDHPRVVVSTTIGRPKHARVLPGGALGDGPLFGDQAVLHRGALTLHHPMERCAVTRWDDMELLWRHALGRLREGPGGDGGMDCSERAVSEREERGWPDWSALAASICHVVV